MNERVRVPSGMSAKADFYMVDRQTILRWRKRGVPIGDVGEMATWATTQRKLPSGFLEHVMQLRDGKPAAKPNAEAKIFESDPDWKTFLAQQKEQPDDADPASSMHALRIARGFSALKFQAAAEAGDKAGMKLFSELLVRFEGAIHDAELRARKLNLDSGELFPASAIDLLGRAVAYWLTNSADLLIGQAADALAKEAAIAPLDRESVRKAIDPLIMATRVLAPLVRASEVNAPVKLPPRFVDAVRAGIAATIENGAAEFDAMYRAPETKSNVLEKKTASVSSAA